MQEEWLLLGVVTVEFEEEQHRGGEELTLVGIGRRNATENLLKSQRTDEKQCSVLFPENREAESRLFRAVAKGCYCRFWAGTEPWRRRVDVGRRVEEKHRWNSPESWRKCPVFRIENRAAAVLLLLLEGGAVTLLSMLEDHLEVLPYYRPKEEGNGGSVVVHARLEELLFLPKLPKLTICCCFCRLRTREEEKLCSGRFHCR